MILCQISPLEISYPALPAYGHKILGACAITVVKFNDGVDAILGSVMIHMAVMGCAFAGLWALFICLFYTRN